MKYFDLHCDTLTAIYDKGENLLSNTCDISLDIMQNFEVYNQVLAIWSEPKYADSELYERFFSVLSNFSNTSLPLPKNFGYILSVEGGALIENDLSRIDKIFECGVRIFTPVWQDLSLIGGAWNTDTGLSDFGKEAIKKCFSLGIIPDASHISDKGFFDLCEISDTFSKPFIASHSNSREICNHKRNLTDEMASVIIKKGGVIGISLYPPHLSESGSATLDDIYRHIEHYLSLGGENAVALGFDLDGTSGMFPEGIRRVNDAEKIYSYLSKKISENILEKIFFSNANNFFERNGIMPQK